MTTVLGATYPDLFAAIAPFAGCAYATCADVTGQLAYQAMGKHARVVPAFVLQGTADPLNNPALGGTQLLQQVGTADWADNDKLDQSVKRQSSETVGSFAPAPGAPDEPCVRNNSFPCPAAALGWKTYPYTVDRFADAKGRLVVESWLVHGLMHDWPGGLIRDKEDAAGPRTTFVDPHGPYVTAAIWAFFEGHPMTKVKPAKD